MNSMSISGHSPLTPSCTWGPLMDILLACYRLALISKDVNDNVLVNDVYENELKINSIKSIEFNSINSINLVATLRAYQLRTY